MNIKLNQEVAYLPIVLPMFFFLACSSRLTERVYVIEHAFDYRNIDSTLASTYTDDIRFELGGIILEGKQALRGGAEWDSVVNTRLSFSDFKMIGDTVICKCTAEDDLLKLQGIEHEYFDPVTIVFDDNRIKYVNFQRTAESRRASSAASRPFNEWASKERSQELTNLMPNGKFVLSAESAKGWLALVKEWRKATKQQ
jgi:hypothetical protein